MKETIPIINKTMELADCRDQWTFDEKHRCWCLEDVLYTAKAAVPKFQRLSIFVPEKLLNADGTFPAAAKNVPVVFENNSAGYMQMPHVWLDGPRCYAQQYLDHGLIYVTCGCRGRESRDKDGRLVGKLPITLVDLKTAIRFLRHNRAVLPGNWERIISAGWSAGGAMSTLLAVTGDNRRYEPYLRENEAFMDESDAVFAAQIYCPIVDLEHADMAYEWMFRADKTCEDSPAGPAETMTPFKEALSAKLSERYVRYFNALGLKNPATGAPLTLDMGGRSGSGYDYLMGCLNASATDFLSRLERGELPQKYSAQDYLSGNYTYLAEAPMPRPAAAHHAGPGTAMPESRTPMSLGDAMSRPPRGVPYQAFEPPMAEFPGKDKRDWLSWDGEKAEITDLDAYVLRHRRRMRPCTSFDKLDMDSGENHAFGTPETDYVHFSPDTARAVAELAGQFPEECAHYSAFTGLEDDPELAERIYLTNPLSFIGTAEQSTQAKHYRIRVGASDADTSLSVSMTLTLKLANAGCGTVDYAMVWDQPHSEADYPGEVLAWIDYICGE